MKILKLVDKFNRVRDEYGIGIAIRRIVHFVGNREGRRVRREDIKHARKKKGNVLFINGCCVEHPTRYRVLHQIEQLQETGVECAKVYFEDIEQGMIDNYKIFVFYRCECTAEVERFISKAKYQGKTVCFDVDDLITNTKYTDLVPFVATLPPRDKKLFDESVLRMGVTLSLCDIATTTTEVLAKELAKVVPKTYINRNVASKEMVLYSEQAYRNKKEKEVIDIDRIWIGYFSGSLTHNKDFSIVHVALMRLMDAYKNVGLILVGELDASDELMKYSDRIIKKNMTDWRALPSLIVEADINLAPLEDTLFNCSKSEIKWLEAALVRVPTVASNVGAFKTMMEHGVTGILCENTEQDWYEKLRNMCLNNETRKKIGYAAYLFALENCTTVSMAFKYRDAVESWSLR